MGKYRKKPVVIEAIQYRPDVPNCQDIARFLGYPDPASFCGDGESHDNLWDLDGHMSAQPGDWIIKDVQGEFYPCRDLIFQQTYESVDP